ncbi:MAG TPA: UDP-N-acetylmuramate--L-alanine ligase [Streptosporangiaceae bacterium]|jgi:UDP-N-acetylmuramate--alanine ligase|nr:UDP-N-acetylmuramate--L-alanine ligase [Streptosporangiaceae bacterium]
MPLVTPVDPVPVDQLGRVHFIGIGGAGMSGIARIMLARGVAVSGSDSGSPGVLSDLAALGADVHTGHSAANLGAADTVVVSSAIRAANPELAEARRRGLRVLPRAGALASVMFGRRATAVAGTHGKTTTTSMLTTILRRCGAQPGYVIGGILAETGLGAEDGTGPDLVAEADESDGSFLMLSPYAAVITNVEADHLDNYSSLAEIQSAFEAFARRVTPGGVLITCADDPGARAVAEASRDLGIRVRSYGESASADYRISAVTARGMGSTVTVTTATSSTSLIAIAVPGRHNALNAAAAFATAVELGFPAGQVAAALSAYRGAQRRMEPKGIGDGVRVLDSYAHHPTEVAADLAAARDIVDGGRVIAIFQPHLFSRTRIFAAELGGALGLADEAIVLDIYAAREDPEPGVTGRLVANAVPGGRAHYIPAGEQVPAVIAEIAKPGDIVLTMGAGDVTRLGPAIVGALRARASAAGATG